MTLSFLIGSHSCCLFFVFSFFQTRQTTIKQRQKQESWKGPEQRNKGKEDGKQFCLSVNGHKWGMFVLLGQIKKRPDVNRARTRI